MKIINIHNAKTHLSKLIQQVLKGEEVVIAKYGKPLVRLKPYRPTNQRSPGVWKDQVWMADDFDELSKEIESGFQGELE
jgi:prevent-host-death family protein